MPTHFPERRAAPGDQSASIVFPITSLAMLLMVAVLAALALSWMEPLFGSDGNILTILSRLPLAPLISKLHHHGLGWS
jgi:hypothetical protein